MLTKRATDSSTAKDEKEPLTSSDKEEKAPLTQPEKKDDRAIVSSMIYLNDGMLIYLCGTLKEIKLAAYFLEAGTHMAMLTFPRSDAEDMLFLEKLKMSEDGAKFELYLPEPGYRSFFGCHRRDPAKDAFIVHTYQLQDDEFVRSSSKKILMKDTVSHDPDYIKKQVAFLETTDQMKIEYGIKTMTNCREMLRTKNGFILSFERDAKIYFVDKANRTVRELDTSEVQYRRLELL